MTQTKTLQEQNFESMHEAAMDMVIETNDYNGMPTMECEFNPKAFMNIIIDDCVFSIQNSKYLSIDEKVTAIEILIAKKV